ncbi:putative MFS transporter [Aspergillus karnatakaensis]|uniref:MFS transporter n=1 Tax=Aspergillus karnatakaensis TaxID=1810916 RepID=UPI003CCC9195
MTTTQQPSRLLKWRSSKTFIVLTICIALFAETFLYAFLVPILGYMFETRLHVDASETQWYTSAILAVHGYVSALSGPIIGHFADKSPRRKGPLIWGLIVCIIGTVLVAWSSSLFVLFVGRMLQGAAGAVVWIVGFATLADLLSQDIMGTAMGMVGSCASLGSISGPMASGLVLEWWGYWATWAIPIVVLAVDIALRLLMIEPEPSSATAAVSESSSGEEEADAGETDRLLSEQEQPPTEPGHFWSVVLRDSRILVAILVPITGVSVGASFSATIPLYVEDAFGWGPARAGALFGYLSVPSLFLSPLVGWIRDRVGVRLPTAVSAVLTAGLLAVLGIAGNRTLVPDLTAGKALYTSTIVVIGIVRPFLGGVGVLEVTRVVREYQDNRPGIFGPAGGLSRILSLTDAAASLGLTIGPIVSGALVELVGYTAMNIVFGGILLIMAILVLVYMGSSRAMD